MARKPTSEKRKERQLTLLRSEMKRALAATSQRRSILKQMVEGKSAESIAAYEHVSVHTVKKHMAAIVAEYKDNFTTEVGFWVEMLMTRYNALLEVLWPLALNREAQAIKFVLDILEAQMMLTGASAADRARQQTVDSYTKKIDGELVISVTDRYKEYLSKMAPNEDNDGTGQEITVLAEGEDRIPSLEAEIPLTLYREDDGV